MVGVGVMRDLAYACAGREEGTGGAGEVRYERASSSVSVPRTFWETTCCINSNSLVETLARGQLVLDWR